MKKQIRHQKFHAPHIERLSSLNGVPLAGFRLRTIAFSLNIVFIIIILILVSLASSYKELFTTGTANINLKFDMFHNMEGIIVLLLYFGTLTYFFKGQTLGKRLMRIRVISLKKDKLTVWQCIERSLGYGASALEAGFGFIQVIFYENRQAVHDRIAETVVIKVRK